MRQQDYWSPECARFLQRVAPGSIPSNRWKLLRVIWQAGHPTATETLAVRSGLPARTVIHTCEELEGVGLVRHSRLGNAFTWEVSPTGHKLIREAGLPHVLERPL